MSDYKVKILTIQTQIFKILIDSLKDVVKDVNLSFDKKGISLITTNQINSLLIKMRIKRESLEFYECKIKDNEKYKIGINMTCFFKIMKTANNDDTLTLYIENDDKTKLNIKLENKVKNIVTFYELKLLDLETDNDDLDLDTKINYNNILSINSQIFHSYIKNMNNIAENVEFIFENVDKPKLSLKCKGDFVQQYSIFKVNNQNDKEQTEASIKILKSSSNDNIIQGTYLLRDVLLFGKCSIISPEIKIKLNNGLPLCIKYNIVNLGRLCLLLSPINNYNYDQNIDIENSNENDNEFFEDQ